MTELSEIVSSLKEIADQEKELKKKKDSLRLELFDYGVLDYSDKEYLLPTTTITVPWEFFAATDISRAEFLESRFPTWTLENKEEDAAMCTTTFVLRKNPLYMPYKYENDDYKLSKTSTEPTPEIDWISLSEELPDLFEKLAKPIVSYELDGEVLEELLAEDPEIISILKRHTVYNREPQQRVAIKEV